MNGIYHPPQPEGPGFLEKVRAFGRKLLLVLLAALAAAGLLHLCRTGTPSSGSRPPATPWVRQHLADISLEAPVTLAPYQPEKEELTPRQLQQLVQRQQWMGRAGDGFRVEAGFLVIDGRHTLSLEDGVKGAFRRFGEMAGEARAPARKTDVFVSGLAARRISGARGSFHFEEVIVQNSRKVAVVLVTFTGDARTDDAERVLRSLHVQTGN